MAKHNRRKKKSDMKWNIAIALLVLVLLGGIVSYTQGFALVPAQDEVWVPSYTTVSCEQTRLECFPGDCSGQDLTFQEKSFHTIDEKGESFWCGAPTMSDADYFEGCDVYLKSSGFFQSLGITSLQKCDGDGTNCRSISVGTLETSNFGSSERKLSLEAGEKLYINPNLAEYGIRLRAPVYGIRIEGGAGQQPVYTDRCNLAQALDNDQIAVLKSSPEYAKIVAATTISPGNYPTPVITSYIPTIYDQRVVERDGKSWYIKDIGLICPIEKDTRERWVVSTPCKTDATVQCFPNIGNCDKNGQLIAETGEDATAQKSCTPGTLVGSSTNRIPVSSDEACRLVCSDAGVPQQTDCVDIPKCTDGTVLSQNYECVDSTKLGEEELCIAGGGKFNEIKDKDGSVTYECDYSPQDNFVLYVILGAVVVIVLLFAIRMRQKRR